MYTLARLAVTGFLAVARVSINGLICGYRAWISKVGNVREGKSWTGLAGMDRTTYGAAHFVMFMFYRSCSSWWTGWTDRSWPTEQCRHRSRQGSAGGWGPRCRCGWCPRASPCFWDQGSGCIDQRWHGVCSQCFLVTGSLTRWRVGGYAEERERHELEGRSKDAGSKRVHMSCFTQEEVHYAQFP